MSISPEKILEAMVAAEREAAERAVLARVRERSLRPEENGAAAGAPFSASAAAALTPAGRAELARRAYAGERIIF